MGFGVGYLGREIDFLLGITAFHSIFTRTLGCLLIALGFLIRVWAAFTFYQHHMRVISLVPQRQLITSGPFRFSRNPLYIGGNLFIFLGAALFLGSPSGIVLTALNIIAVEMMIRREERQLAREFGDEWRQYRRNVPRWF